MANPAFRTAAFGQAPARKGQLQQTLSAEQLDQLYGRPAAGPVETDRMSLDDVIVKTLVTLGVLLVGAVIGFNLYFLYIPFIFVGFALAMVNIFKKQPSAPLVLAYGFAEGVFAGGLSRVVESVWPGIIYQALLGTAIVFGITLVLFATGKVRESKRATKVFLIAISAYALFSLINFVLQITGINSDAWGLYSGVMLFGKIPLGLIIGPLAILLAAYSLVMDFSAIQNGIAQGAPRRWGWRGAFGLTVTIVWLYVEILRLIGIVRN